MLKISKNLTTRNYTPMVNKRNMWIVIHYVGAVSTAFDNTEYFKSAYRGASANYFVDANSIWQCVEDDNKAWHVGANKYYNSCRNENSIGIEMCCKKKDGKWYFEPETEIKTMQLTKYLMKLHNIPIERVCRHYDVTRKVCGEPYVRDPIAWRGFIEGVKVMDEKVVTLEEKIEAIKNYYGYDDNTIKYFQFYRYGTALLDKLYDKVKMA